MTEPAERIIERHIEHVEVTGLEPFVRELVALQTDLVMVAVWCMAGLVLVVALGVLAWARGRNTNRAQLRRSSRLPNLETPPGDVG